MKPLLAASLLMLSAGIAVAQQPPATHTAPTPGVASSTTINPKAPVAGANSFTESQAQSRLKTAGFTDVTGLVKDNNGVWRGKAAKAGKPVNVSLDYQGNITTN